MVDKAPDVVGETAYLVLDGKKGPRILPRAENLEAIADDAVIESDDNITTKIAVSAPDALPSDGQLDLEDFDVTDLAGNTLTIDILDIA